MDMVLTASEVDVYLDLDALQKMQCHNFGDEDISMLNRAASYN